MKKQQIITIVTIIAIVAIIIAIAYVGYGIVKKVTTKQQNPVATIEVQDYGTIKVELYPDQAPNTVANFIKLANNGYYDGKTFHRVISGFMIQGGAKNEDGSGSPTLDDLLKNGSTKEYSIKGEMIANGYNDNKIKLKEGVIAMARSDYSSISTSLLDEGYNSAGSQFFIVHKDYDSLNGLYTGFGKVIEGMDIVNKIADLEVEYKSADLAEGEEAPTDAEGNALTADKPVNPPVITSIKVETYGVDYGDPETMEPFSYYNYIMEQYSSYFSEQQ